MSKAKIATATAIVAAIILALFLGGYFLKHTEPTLLQGTVECQSYKASSKIAGRIVEMNVKQGDRVTKGELLYTLSTPELDAKLRQAEAAQSAASALDQKALVGARQQQIQEARNMWQKAQAGLALAQKTFSRIDNLHKQGVVAAQKYDEAEAALQASKATEAAAKAQYDLVVAGASKQDKQAAEAQLWQAQGAVSEVQTYIDDAMVYSPTNGVVESIVAREGELVGSGMPVVTIIDDQDSWAIFNIKETLLPCFKIGSTLEAYIPALNSVLTLKIYYISAQADFATWNATRTQGDFDIRTFAVKARPANPTNILRPGMSAIIDLDQINNKQ